MDMIALLCIVVGGLGFSVSLLWLWWNLFWFYRDENRD